MSYGALMVYLRLGHPNAGLLQIAGDLAVRFQAGIIGIAARQPARIGAGRGFVFWHHADRDREAADNEMIDAEAEFRSALQSRIVDLEWRSAMMCASISDYLVREVISADLLVIDIAADVFNSSRRVDTCDFVMKLGRPVIVVPTATGRHDARQERNGSRGAEMNRQSVNDALPKFDWAARMGVGQIVSWTS